MLKDENNLPKMTLADKLSKLRTLAGLTLRQVEEVTEKEVSNAYLSQLENGRITKPSPNILHALASAYNASYEELMELAGYLTSGADQSSERRHAKTATLSIGNITPDEEKALLEYLKFLRHKRKRT
jgi:transcriptional regulator with XRE-family HTH domain